MNVLEFFRLCARRHWVVAELDPRSYHFSRRSRDEVALMRHGEIVSAHAAATFLPATLRVRGGNGAEGELTLSGAAYKFPPLAFPDGRRAPDQFVQVTSLLNRMIGRPVAKIPEQFAHLEIIEAAEPPSQDDPKMELEKT